jgi:penicillin amidase
LKNRVRVFWQSGAIPHVFASDEHDLFFAQGYLHAQERLWQMELNRRFLSGRSAETFGRFPVPAQELTSQFRDCDTTDVDHFMRLVGIRRAALAAAAALGEEDRYRLESYCAGVNAYIERCGKQLPLEFRLLRCRPEPWRPEDTLTITKGFAFVLSLALFSRLNALAIAAHLADEPEKFDDLYPSGLGGEVTTARVLRDAARGVWQFTGALAAVAAPTGNGSNAWVIGPERSRSGTALLCNDPHLRLTLPSMWYLMRLSAPATQAQTEGYEVWGGTLAGCPGVQLGHNRHIAWGLTAALCDDVELYRENVHRLEPDRYEIDGRWHVMERENEVIEVRGEAAVARTIRRTHHGPVISDFRQSPGSAAVVSLAWTAHEPGADLHALYKLNRARNWQEFLDALSHHGAPTLNFLYADRAANIGFALAGKVPLRQTAPSLLPLNGWQSALQWRGSVPFEELPRLFNPADGAIANANNRIVDEQYPHYLSRFFEPPYRVRRIHELIAARKSHGRADMAAAQADRHSIHARELLQILHDDLAAACGTSAHSARAARRLCEWDGECAADSVAAGLFQVFYQRLIENLLAPHLGAELFATYVEVFNQSTLPIAQILRAPSSPWWRGTTRAALVRRSLEEACTELSQTFGPDEQAWQWGRLHTLTLNHPFSRVGLLRPLFSAGPFPAAGDNFTVELGFYRRSHPYEQIVGPSLRMIVEAGPDLRSWFSLPSGQSGDPFSEHFLDLRERWQRNDHVELSVPSEQIEAGPMLTLKPAAAAREPDPGHRA